MVLQIHDTSMYNLVVLQIHISLISTLWFYRYTIPLCTTLWFYRYTFLQIHDTSQQTHISFLTTLWFYRYTIPHSRHTFHFKQPCGFTDTRYLTADKHFISNNLVVLQIHDTSQQTHISFQTTLWFYRYTIPHSRHTFHF